MLAAAAVVAIILMLSYYLLNFRTILSLIAGLAFFLALITVPVFIARLVIIRELLGVHYSFPLVYLIALAGVVLFAFKAWGKNIFRDRVLNFIMGIALLAGLCFSLIFLAFGRVR